MISRMGTAYHEAGHAVVALCVGWDIVSITVENAQNGCTVTESRGRYGRSIRDDCLVLIGGWAGEHRWTTTHRGSNVDTELDVVRERCRRRIGAEWEAPFEGLRVEAWDMIERNAPAFLTFVSALKERPDRLSIEGDELTTLLASLTIV